jgi:methionyl-tRNA formyltransferase
MLRVAKTEIGDDETAGALHDRLSHLGAQLLEEGLAARAAGTLLRTKQDDAAATHAPMLTKETGRIDFAKGARAVKSLVLGCDPWPGAFTTLGGEPLRVWNVKVISGRGEPGVVLGADRDGLWVGAGADAVAIGELQAAGRKRMAAGAFLAGRAIPVGTRLGG